MTKGFFSVLAILCFSMSMPGKAHAQQLEETTTIILTRHAEKENSKDPDPDLSAAGKQRAQKLASLLKDVPVTRLLSTPYKRTNQTLAVLSKEKGITIEPYDPSKVDELQLMIREAKGQTLVIAGHANTIPELVNVLLGAKKYSPLKEDEFGKVWVVTLQQDRIVSCILLNTN